MEYALFDITLGSVYVPAQSLGIGWSTVHLQDAADRLMLYRCMKECQRMLFSLCKLAF
jgi:hypothetical protein